MFGVKISKHVQARIINTYLEAYADEFGISDVINLQTKVVVAEDQETADGGGGGNKP